MQIPLRRRVNYLLREHFPYVSVEDDGAGAMGLRVSYRYANIFRRTSARGGNGNSPGSIQRPTKPQAENAAGGSDGDEIHPVEDLVQRKLDSDFTEEGYARVARVDHQARATAAKRGRLDKYEKLVIPGSVFHIRKKGAGGGSGNVREEDNEVWNERRPRYWMERVPANQVFVQ